MMIHQYHLYIVDLNPSIGSEMKKVRPCIVLSPDEANRHLRTVIVAPITSKVHHYPFRVPVSAEKCVGEIALDHIRSIDKSRLTKQIGELDKNTIPKLKAVLKEFLVD